MRPRTLSQMYFCCSLHVWSWVTWATWEMWEMSPAAVVSLAKSCATGSNRVSCRSTHQAVNDTGTLQATLQAMDPSLTDDDMANVLEMFDADRTGEIGKHEFIQALETMKTFG